MRRNVMKKLIKKIPALLCALAVAMQLTAVPAFAAEPETVIESDLSAETDGVETNEFEIGKQWYWGRCGFESDRAVYRATAKTDSYMIFDAGKGGTFTSGELRVTVHMGSSYIMTSQLDKRVYVSDDKTDWTAVTGDSISAEKDEISHKGDGVEHYHYTLKVSLNEGKRYLKFSADGALMGGHVFVHGAKLMGYKGTEETTPDPEPSTDPEADEVFTDPCATASLAKNDYLSAVYTDMTAVNWNMTWVPERSDNYLVSGGNNALDDTITYTVNDNAKDLVYAKVRMLEKSGSKTPVMSASRNGVTWTAGTEMTRLSSDSLAAADAHEFRDNTYLVTIPANMKSVKLTFSGAGGAYRLMSIDLGLSASTYAYDRINFDGTPTAVFSGGKWTVKGSITCSAADSQTVTAILCVYKNGKMIDITAKELNLTSGSNTLAISSGSISQSGTKAALYIWDSTDGMIAVMSEAVTFE